MTRTSKKQAPESKPLTPREWRCVLAYLQTGNQAKAAELVGVKHPPQMHEILHRPHVQKLLADAQKAAAEGLGESVQGIVADLRGVADKCMEADTKGRIDSAGANRALELMGKHLRMFIDRQEISEGGLTPEQRAVYDEWRDRCRRMNLEELRSMVEGPPEGQVQ